MRKRDHSQSPGMFRTGAYVAAIAIIAVQTLRAVLRIVVKTVDGISESRSSRA